MHSIAWKAYLFGIEAARLNFGSSAIAKLVLGTRLDSWKAPGGE